MLALDAMKLARRLHADQRRKYTGNPYTDHLAEVAGITAAALIGHGSQDLVDRAVAVAWLHDSIEDQGATFDQLRDAFNTTVAEGVLALSDLEAGNRAERKAASRARLSRAPGWVQTIKVADLISNTSSIVQHDRKFAAVYLEEKRQLLSVLTQADRALLRIAGEQVEATLASISKIDHSTQR